MLTKHVASVVLAPLSSFHHVIAADPQLMRNPLLCVLCSQNSNHNGGGGVDDKKVAPPAVKM